MQLIDYCSIIGDFSRQVLRENVIYNFSESIHRVVSIDVLGNGTRMACKQLDDALVNAGFCQFRDVGGSTLVSNVILQARIGSPVSLENLIGFPEQSGFHIDFEDRDEPIWKRDVSDSGSRF